MPVQHSPPAKNTRSKRHQAVLTPTASSPLDCTPSVHQLSPNLDRGPPMEGAAPSRRGGLKSRRSRPFSGFLGGYPRIPQGPQSRLGEAEDEEGRTHYNQPLVSQVEPSLPKMMEQMTQFIGQLTQAVAPRDTSKAPAFKTPSMKAADSFDGTKSCKLRGFIQSCQLNFHNDPANFFDRKKLFPLFGDPNEVRKDEQELDNLRMKESGQASLYIADFRRLMSRIGDWGERAYIHVYRRVLASRLLDQLASHPGNFYSLRELMDITLELDTRYHERQKEKGSHQEKKPPITGSNSSKPPQSS
ncbi:hypothetical protein O181_006851 [Austropuccinia psidii MF-1]|uniref:Retrotransposon gag domain-containing protein n=1 Tax=Austropuccinia psidii MF-1 TaxID=1389203 RepID=A0A9Q3BLN6_9BASI|nr:hypothetical protein [Austropuccinia psidii MF-1]